MSKIRIIGKYFSKICYYLIKSLLFPLPLSPHSHVSCKVLIWCFGAILCLETTPGIWGRVTNPSWVFQPDGDMQVEQLLKTMTFTNTIHLGVGYSPPPQLLSIVNRLVPYILCLCLQTQVLEFLILFYRSKPFLTSSFNELDNAVVRFLLYM